MQLHRILSIITAILLSGILAAGSLFNSQLQYSEYLALGLIPAILAYFSPLWAISGFLFLIPVFGNKPATLQDSCLLISAMSLQVGLSCRFIRKQYYKTDLVTVFFPYLLISALSLFPVSYLQFKGWLISSQGSLTDFQLLGFNLESVLFSAEDHPAYPFKSVLLTFLATALAISVSKVASQQIEYRKIFVWSLFSGFVISLFVGLLDFYEIISIRGLRALDPVVNPEKFAYRLQSWFGHSGWYAEYLTLAAPFVMIMLCLKRSYLIRVVLIILTLLLAEFVLILTFQRGGWLSYPVTLIAIWSAIYVLYRQERGQSDIFSALQSSFKKIIISAPLTVLISMGILNLIGSSFSLEQYTSRFKDITKASDRTDFMLAAIKLGNLNPLLGQGSESFALQYKREFLEPDGSYHGQINLPLHGTAHSLYAQTFMGKGILGILALFAMMSAAIIRGFRLSVSTINIADSDRIIALACSCSVLALAIYGFVQEIFYINSLQYMCFMVFALLYSIPYTQITSKRKSKIIFSLIAVLFMLHLIFYKYNSRSYTDSFGCSPAESDQSGAYWRWCGLRSEIFISKQTLDKVGIQMSPAQSGSQNIEISSCGQILFNQKLNPGEEAELNLSALNTSNCKDAPEGFVRIRAITGNYFVPAIENPKSADRRVLSFRWLH